MLFSQLRLYSISRTFAITACLFFLGCLAPAFAIDEPEFPWGRTSRILFFGDSITQAGGYINDVEAFLFTRFPAGNETVINHGISSETISGTSEPDHDPRRPDAQERFERDVENWEPDVLVACFGMNDGNYLPPELAPMAAYQAGVNKLIERTKRAGIPQIVLLTPPPFDPYRRQSGDANATHYGYKFAAINYDDTLAGFAAWLKTLQSLPNLRVIDLHTKLNEHLKARRQERVSFYLAGDAVHPNSTGHLLMAANLLKGLGPIPPLASAEIDAKSREVKSGRIQFQSPGEALLRLTWTTGLPWPLPADVDQDSVKLESIGATFNRLDLTIDGLDDGQYEAFGQAGDQAEQSLGTFQSSAGKAHAQLSFPESAPFFATEAATFRTKLEARNQARYSAWRAAIQTADFTDDLHLPANDPKLTRELQELATARPWELIIKRRQP